MSLSIENDVLGLAAIEESNAAFFQRHESLVQNSRESFMGVTATEAALKDEQLREQFGQDFDRLTEEQRDLLKQPNWDEIQRLKTRFLPERTLLTAVSALDAQRQNRNKVGAEEDFPHQQDILDDILRSLSDGKKEGHVVLATAGGKSYLIAKLTDIFAQAGLRVLELGPTKQIARQLVGEDGSEGLGKFASPETKAKVGKQFGGNKATGSNQVVVSTYQSFNNFVEDPELGKFDVELCDEAHRALGQITSSNLKKSNPHAIKIAFTATPRYGANKAVNEIFPEPIHSLDLREAIDNGIVSPVQCLEYSTGEEIKIKDFYRQDFSDRELRRLINLKSRNVKALQFAQDFVQSGRQGIIACLPGADLAHARLMAQELSKREVTDSRSGLTRNIVARAVGGSIGSDQEQLETLNAYKRGEIDVLTFVNVLSEGWDSKKASFLINTCPTTSLVKITQQIGRVIRLKQNKQHAIVVDFIDEAIGKEQKTALQALGQEQVDLTKIYGLPSTPQGTGDALTYLRGILDPDLYNQLAVANGRMITDLTLPAKNALYRARSFEHYERLLAKDGLSPDTHLMGIPIESLKAIQEAEDDFISLYDREPTSEELLSEWGTSKLFGTVSRSEQLRRVDTARHLRQLDLIGLMLDEPEVADGGGSEAYWTPEEWAELATLKESLQRAMGLELDEQEMQIVNLRFGLPRCRQPKTLKQVGNDVNLSPERVRQSEATAFSKLRHPKRSESLYDLISSGQRYGSDQERVKQYAWQRALKRFAQEPIGLQAIVLNNLNSSDKEALFFRYRGYFSPLLQEHLAKLNGGSLYTYDNDESGWISGSFIKTYPRIARLMKGDFNSLLPQLTSEEHDAVRKRIQLRNPLLSVKLDTLPTTLDDLTYPHHSHSVPAKKFRAILSNLDFSDYIAGRALLIHDKLAEHFPFAQLQLPLMREEVSHYLRLDQESLHDINNLLAKWGLDKEFSNYCLETYKRLHPSRITHTTEDDSSTEKPFVSTRDIDDFISDLIHRIPSYNRAESRSQTVTNTNNS